MEVVGLEVQFPIAAGAKFLDFLEMGGVGWGDERRVFGRGWRESDGMGYVKEGGRWMGYCLFYCGGDGRWNNGHCWGKVRLSLVVELERSIVCVFLSSLDVKERYKERIFL